MKPTKLKIYLGFLNELDAVLDRLEKFDRDGGYGDFVQNFEDAERIRITSRLRKLVVADIKRGAK